MLELAIAHEYLAIDDYGPHVACLSTVNDLAEKIIDRLDMGSFQIDQNQIGALADLERAADR